MSEIGVSFEALCGLAKLSQQNGTTNAFIPVALQWAGKANAEIDQLRKEKAALEKELDRAVDTTY